MRGTAIIENVAVVDLFCGAGGLSFGFKKEGFEVSCGIDIDADCKYPFETNNKTKFLLKNIKDLRPEELVECFGEKETKVLVGCAPCQPFSTYNHKNNNPDWELLQSFSTLISATLPDVVSMENVPQLLKFNDGKVFNSFRECLESNNYFISFDVLYGPDFGLPQKRSRLVLLASRLGPIAMPKPTHKERHKSVKDAIAKLPALEAGQTDCKDPLHRASSLSPINLKRIRASKPGGSWKDWDKSLVSDCHLKETGKSYGSVYGRMTWDKPSPTITTQFKGFGNGRFGHPEQDRALSLREGAILQGFPKGYKFINRKNPASSSKISQMIGNAVPVTISRAIARSIKEHLKEHENE